MQSQQDIVITKINTSTYISIQNPYTSKQTRKKFSKVRIVTDHEI